ncbi:MAG: amino acid permease [Alphaproteobacteria bacterium]|nr:amino acid permease [Alphaproteobacteria bacterium]
MNLRKKNIHDVVTEAKKNSLNKTLTAVDLVMLGIGGTIGTGIFVVTGIAAAKYAGPAIAISYLVAAFVCVFAALAYAELASMVPIAGSAYTYSYVTMGEFVAWLVGWGLILEYGVGAATVAAGWAGYVTGILKSGGITIPEIFTKTPDSGGLINLPAVLISLFIGAMLYRGMKQGVALNRVLVVIKLLVIFIFLLIATPMIKTENWEDFTPFGINGILMGAAIVFYAYIGFDCIATAAEECKNPRHDLPIGIIGSLLICMILYTSVSLILTGIAPYFSLNNTEPVAKALRENGSNIGSALVATGAVAGMTSVLLILIYGQSRIFFVMARDRLLPAFINKIHRKFDTPHRSVVLTSFAVAMTAGLLPLEVLSQLVSLGTLFAFMVVALGVLILRITDPKAHRSFHCPAVYFTAPMAILSCGYLVWSLLMQNGVWFMLWSLLGLIVYFTYGYHKSPLGKKS